MKQTTSTLEVRTHPPTKSLLAKHNPRIPQRVKQRSLDLWAPMCSETAPPQCHEGNLEPQDTNRSGSNPQRQSLFHESNDALGKRPRINAKTCIRHGMSRCRRANRLQSFAHYFLKNICEEALGGSQIFAKIVHGAWARARYAPRPIPFSAMPHPGVDASLGDLVGACELWRAPTAKKESEVKAEPRSVSPALCFAPHACHRSRPQPEDPRRPSHERVVNQPPERKCLKTYWVCKQSAFGKL